MNPTDKPKWYSIRLRILDYSIRQLGVSWIILSLGLCGLGYLIFQLPSEHRQQFKTPAFCFVGLWIATSGAWIYKWFTGHQKRNTRALNSRFESVPQQVSLTLVIIAGIAAAWFFSREAGLSNDTIARILGISGVTLIGVCVLVVLVMIMRNRRH